METNNEEIVEKKPKTHGTILVKCQTKHSLVGMKLHHRESYDDVINRLIKEYECRSDNDVVQ